MADSISIFSVVVGEGGQVKPGKSYWTAVFSRLPGQFYDCPLGDRSKWLDWCRAKKGRDGIDLCACPIRATARRPKSRGAWGLAAEGEGEKKPTAKPSSSSVAVNGPQRQPWPVQSQRLTTWRSSSKRSSQLSLPHLPFLRLFFFYF